MKSISIKNPQLLHFGDNGGFRHYGATQTWYTNYWQRMSGCGPTTATNLLIYLAATREHCKNLFNPKSLDKSAVKDFMDTIWQFITPTMMGVNKTQILAAGVTDFAAQQGVSLLPHSLNIPASTSPRPSLEALSQFLVSNVEHDLPIPFLNLSAGSTPNLSSWHWVLIVGIEYGDNHLSTVIYDEGRQKTIDLKRWLETTTAGGGFVTFSPS